MSRARDRGGSDSLERRKASGDADADGIFGPLDPTAKLEGDGPGIPDQLGKRLSLGGVVCGMGFSAAQVGRCTVVGH